MAELDRRDFLKLVGAGAGAAATVGCSDPVEKLIPYVIQPEEITPGIAVHYASTCRECPAACGLHVTTREGRPVKLEGNPDHPVNRGALCARGQAGIGRTYHPDRYEGPMSRGDDGVLRPVSWEQAVGQLAGALRESAPRTWILGGDSGPALGDLIDRWVEAVGVAGRLVYEPFAHEALRAATSQVFGVATLPVFDLSQADLIVNFGSDFLDSWLSPVEHMRQVAEARDVDQREHGGARLVHIGPRLSMSGSNADQWIPASPGSEGALALALAAEVQRRRPRAIAGDAAALKSVLSRIDARDAARRAGVDRATLDELATRLVEAKSAVALPPGVALTSGKATATAAAVLVLNAVLGAVGSAVRIPARASGPAPASMADLKQLIASMKSGQVDVLLIHDANPLYSLPADSGFAEALERVKLVVSFASLADETSERAHLILPDHTPLESWGDASPRDGVRSLLQPTLRPLHDTQALGDTLIAIGRENGISLGAGSFRDWLESAWGAGQGFRTSLDRGGVFKPIARQPASIASTLAALDFEAPRFEGRGEYLLVAYPHSYLADGRGAALPWLQEIPDPVGRAAWQSWAEISNETARSLGVGFGDVIEVQTGYGAGAVELPVYPRGGIRDDVVAIAIGQGHTVGHYASLAGDGRPGEARGVSVISILPASSDERGGRSWLNVRASIRSTGAFRRIPLSQWTDNQRGRGLAQEVSLLALAQGAHAGNGHGEEEGHHGPPELPYDGGNDAHPDSEYRWAMTIDTDRCTGCSACVAACYVENNIPLVGEDGVTRHREMTWIRIDRYVGDGDREGGEERRPVPDREKYGEVDVRHAPMLCQQCGAAPCEAVCPTLATYHNPEGLNGMIYNRCIGTRYCANNCVYKVRRFNYFDYSRENWPGLLGMMLNPDVTVRAQGVMEKCTFCVQRIQAARQPAKDEGRPIADGEVVTACQQSCPAQAITFGNLLDEKSAVSVANHAPARAYHALHSLNARPAITYLAQVKREDERSHG